MSDGKKKKFKELVWFNNSERELCSVCKFPEGFCKHTIEKEYFDLCPTTPLTKEDIWQLVRSHAISQTQKRNIWDNLSKENNELKDTNLHLMSENLELRHFKKHIEEILFKTIKSNIEEKQKKVSE